MSTGISLVLPLLYILAASLSGQIRRPRVVHAPLLWSPRKRGVATALVRQVSTVIGWRLGRCSSVPWFHLC